MKIVGVIPYVIALLGMVMLPNPVVPSWPVRMNDTIVVLAD